MQKIIDISLQVVKNFADFKTRSSKTEFWVFALTTMVVGALIGFVSHFLSSLFSLILFVPSLSVGVRRFHDIGKSGANLLWLFLPIIGWIYMIVLWLKDGDNEPNRYGDVPAKIEL